MSVPSSSVVLQSMSEDRSAYVYAIVVDGVVRYIGKGSGDRLVYHMTIARRVLRTGSEGNRRGTTRRLYIELASAIGLGSRIELTKLREGLSVHEAFAEERALVAKAGPDHLWNMRAGGAGGSPTQEVRAKISASVSESWKDPARKLISKSPEGQASKSAKNRAAWADQVRRAQRVENMTRAANEPHRRAAVSAALSRRWADPEARKRQSERNATIAADPEVRKRISDGVRASYARRKALQ